MDLPLVRCPATFGGSLKRIYHEKNKSGSGRRAVHNVFQYHAGLFFGRGGRACRQLGEGIRFRRSGEMLCSDLYRERGSLCGNRRIRRILFSCRGEAAQVAQRLFLPFHCSGPQQNDGWSRGVSSVFFLQGKGEASNRNTRWKIAREAEDAAPLSAENALRKERRFSWNRLRYHPFHVGMQEHAGRSGTAVCCPVHGFLLCVLSAPWKTPTIVRAQCRKTGRGEGEHRLRPRICSG